MGELLNLVGLSTGVVLYAMLFTMVVRARTMEAADGSLDRLPLATAIFGLAWNVCAIPIYELPNVGIRGPLPYLSAIGFSALGFLPAVVVHSVLRTEDDRVQGQGQKLLTAAGYAASTLAALAHIGSWWIGAPVPSPFPIFSRLARCHPGAARGFVPRSTRSEH